MINISTSSSSFVQFMSLKRRITHIRNDTKIIKYEMEVTKSITKLTTLLMEGRGHRFGGFTKISPIITSNY